MSLLRTPLPVGTTEWVLMEVKNESGTAVSPHSKGSYPPTGLSRQLQYSNLFLFIFRVSLGFKCSDDSLGLAEI